jgi:hypothetical protein
VEVAGELTGLFCLWKSAREIFLTGELDGCGNVQIPAHLGGFGGVPPSHPIRESPVNMRVGAMSIAQLANLIFISNGLRVKY